MEKMVLGADHAGFQLKERVAGHLRSLGFDVVDTGCFSEASVDYPAVSATVAKAISDAQGENPDAQVRGVLCCGSGIGVCIAANRFPWIRAVEAHDHNTVKMSRRHNDTNVLCLGARVLATELALELLDSWLGIPFDGGRHQKRVDMMNHVNSSESASALDSSKETSAC